MTQRPDGQIEGNARLVRTRAATRLAIVAERIWPLLLPLLLVLCVAAGLAWFGLLRMLPEGGRIGLAVAVALALVAALYPLRNFRRPSASEIDRRIETANGLPHSPVLVQADRPAVQAADPFVAALWREHQARMAAQLAGLHGDLPRTGVPARDPWALRALAVLFAAVAFAFSFGPSGGRLGDVFGTVAGAEPLPVRIDAWVTPPAYTGKAPVFLSEREGGAPVTVPAGSEVSLRVSGGSGAETLAYSDAKGEQELPRKAVGAEVAAAGAVQPVQFAGKLASNGALVLADGPRELRRWTFSVTPDRPPVLRWAAEPKAAANGTLELAYTVEDDYGAVSAKSDFSLADAQSAEARPLYPAPDMPLGLPRRAAPGAKAAPAAKASRDLTEHVWAGSTVKLTLHATDGAGQEAASPVKEIVLPEHPFSNPLARALIEQRKHLGMDANAKAEVLDMLDAMMLRPEDTFPNLSHFLGVETARSRLALARNDDDLRGVVDYLWQVAIAIEEGGLSDAQKRLARAQEALKQALQNGASDQEIDRLMKELRQAMNEFLREFAEQARKNPDMSRDMPKDGQEMRPQDLDRMLEQIEKQAKAGNRDQAEQLLSELQEMMNNLQAGRQQQNGDSQQNSEMRKQMNKLGEIMRRQQEMMNKTFRMQQGQAGDGEEGEQQEGRNGEQGQQQGGEGGQQRPMTPEEFAEALKKLGQGQGQLQQDLQGLQKSLEGMGMQPSEGFGEAGKEMGRAQGSLNRGEGDQAVGEQGRALEALRRGAQNMMQQMQQAMQGEEGGSEEGGRQRNADRDPLGRPRATSGPDFGDSVKVPDEIDVQRARQILEAIRKRLGDALSPQLEKDYLERLLEMR